MLKYKSNEHILFTNPKIYHIKDHFKITKKL